jgi:hypothetical protein
MSVVQSLTGVYDADGGLRGEFAYPAGKLRGHHCSLCDITHSPLRRRREWDTFVASLPVPFDVVQRNERSPRVAQATDGREPCVVAHCDDDRMVVLLDDTTLLAAADIAGLTRALDDAMNAHQLQWPPR